MQISINRNILSNAIDKCVNIAASRSTLPILSNIRIATNDNVQFSATNLEIGIKLNVNAEITESGSITIPAKKFHEITKALNSDDDVILKTIPSDRVQITHAKAKFTIVGLPDDDFPTMADIPEGAFTINAGVLKGLFSHSVYAASIEATRPFLNGVFLEAQNGQITAVGTDGKRLALSSADCEASINGQIIPIFTVTAVMRTFSDDTELKIALVDSDHQMIFADGKTSLITRLIDGDYADYKSVIAPVAKNENVLTADITKLRDAVKRISLVSHPKAPSVHLKITQDVLNLKSSTPELGEATEDLNCTYNGEPLTIAISSIFLLDVLNRIQSDTVSIQIHDPLSPVFIKDAGNQSVIMPMRL